MPVPRKALGRGLSDLLGEPEVEVSRLREIDIERIRPNAQQPRTSFDENGLDDLARSIQTHGVVQPIVVRAAEGGEFQIVAGERRWRAAQRAGLDRIPAIVRDAEEDRSLELALVENLQREDLNPVDEALAYQRLLSDFGLSQEEVANRVGKNRASVANMLRLLKLPEEVRQWLRQGQLTVGHAKALLSLPDGAATVETAREIIRGNYTVRQAEALVGRRARGRNQETEAEGDPNVAAALRTLERVLGTKVRIRERNGKGRIEIEFHSQVELDRLYSGLVAAKF